MKQEKFIELWNIHANEWCKKEKIKHNGVSQNVSDICRIKNDFGKEVYREYEIIKKVTKQLYFGSTDVKINRFKRAAVIVYAINSLEPLEFNDGYLGDDVSIDSLLLTQRLAFHVGLQSIVMQYPKAQIDEKLKSGSLFDFSIQSVGVGYNDTDSFLEGLYKDIFFSKIYKNYNVLTMANVFLLLTERSSQLANLCRKTID